MQETSAEKKSGSRLTLKQIGYLLLLILWVVGLLMILIGNAKMSNAKKAVEAADARSVQATTMAAEMAWQRIQDGRGLAEVNDIRGADQKLKAASELIDIMLAVAPPAKQTAARDARASIDEARGKLTSDKEAVDGLLSKAGQALYELSGKTTGS